MKNQLKIDHLEETKNWRPSNNTVISVYHIRKYDKRALDLGSGSFRNSKYLLNSGFIIDAIDKDKTVRKYTDIFKHQPKGLFNLTVKDYSKMDYGISKYDIIIAQNTLSFNTHNVVDKVLVKVKKALKVGGVFAGNFYGLNDFRSRNKKMSFYTKDEAIVLLNKLGKLIMFQEDEGLLESNNKKWHTYEFVVAK